MKKSIRLILIMLCMSSGVFAQVKFSLGVKGGPNFAMINTDKSANTNYKSRTGFNAGAFALFKFSKIGIQPEVLFSQQGSKAEYSGQPDIKSNFSYVNIPIIIKLYTVAGINLQVGPQLGFLVGAQSNYDPTSGQQLSSTQDVKSAYKKSDFSAALGVGWDLPFGLTIDARYNLGLSDINNGSSGASTSTKKNQVWQFSIGYKLFTLGK